MKQVKRNAQGEITHILVGADMMSKEDAHKVMYGNVDPCQVEEQLKKIYGRVNVMDAMTMIADILNEKEPLYETKKRMMGFKK